MGSKRIYGHYLYKHFLSYISSKRKNIVFMCSVMKAGEEAESSITCYVLGQQVVEFTCWLCVRNKFNKFKSLPFKFSSPFYLHKTTQNGLVNSFYMTETTQRPSLHNNDKASRALDVFENCTMMCHKWQLHKIKLILQFRFYKT